MSGLSLDERSDVWYQVFKKMESKSSKKEGGAVRNPPFEKRGKEKRIEKESYTNRFKENQTVKLTERQETRRKKKEINGERKNK